jgi:hypothetical protein
MGGIVKSLLSASAPLLDPLDIAGTIAGSGQPGNWVSNPGAATQGGVETAPADGYIAGMAGPTSPFYAAKPMGDRGYRAAPPPPPPPRWVYDPKKGASWATPKLNSGTNDYDMVANAPGSEGYNSFKGNRI